MVGDEVNHAQCLNLAAIFADTHSHFPNAKWQNNCLNKLARTDVMSFITVQYQTRTIPGIGIEVLVFWPVLVLVLVLKF